MFYVPILFSSLGTGDDGALLNAVIIGSVNLVSTGEAPSPRGWQAGGKRSALPLLRCNPSQLLPCLAGIRPI